MLSNIQAIFFDLDNTLIDRNAAFDQCINAFFISNLSDFDYKKERGSILKKDNWGYTSRIEFCSWFIQKYQPKNYNKQTFWQYQKRTISDYINPISNELKLLLNQLKKQYIIGIITNGSIYNQSRKLEKAKFLDIFDKKNIFISEEYKISKPNPKIFTIVLNKLNLKSDKLLYIGDDAINDILGAKQVGIKTCWLQQGRIWEEDFLSDFELDSILKI